MALAGDEERVNDRGAVTGVGVADEAPYLAPSLLGRMAFSTEWGKRLAGDLVSEKCDLE